MKRCVVVALALVLMLMLVPRASQAQPSQQGFTVLLDPSGEIQQGRTALVRVVGAGVTQARATFLGRLVELHEMRPGEWIGFLAVNMDTSVGAYTLDLFVWVNNEATPTYMNHNITVLYGGFETQAVELSFGLESLLDPQLNAMNFDTIERANNRTSPERLFTTFQQPVPGPSISNFGGWRNYNGGRLTGRHTGSDFRAVTGTPVEAISDGRVVFTRYMPIHGNHIVVDHGWGILSGYSHLSEILVVPGQLVHKGDVIGLVGATGRVQGPHLHFEMAVNGNWVDAMQFLALNIPS